MKTFLWGRRMPARPKLLIFWNWVPKNIPDQQKCVGFQKSKKVLNHSTLPNIPILFSLFSSSFFSEYILKRLYLYLWLHPIKRLSNKIFISEWILKRLFSIMRSSSLTASYKETIARDLCPWLHHPIETIAGDLHPWLHPKETIARDCHSCLNKFFISERSIKRQGHAIFILDCILKRLSHEICISIFHDWHPSGPLDLSYFICVWLRSGSN